MLVQSIRVGHKFFVLSAHLGTPAGRAICIVSTPYVTLVEQTLLSPIPFMNSVKRSLLDVISFNIL